MRRKRAIFWPAGLAICAIAAAWAARDDWADYPYLPFDHPAIDYDKRPPQDAIARLQEKIDRGQVQLKFDSQHGYLPSILKELDIHADSQMLVFSKTSFQGPRISPRNPRALYFNDEAAIGYVPDGDVLEFTALDPNQGIIFYTMEQPKAKTPEFVRRKQECLNCHLIGGTLYVPGLLATSIIPRPDGSPRFIAAGIVVDSRTPLDQRWGGWYVTGRSGDLVHRGNATAPNPDQPSVLDTRDTQNLTSLAGRFDATRYMQPASDLVALMTLEHQNRMTSFFTRLNWETRLAEKDEKMAAAFQERLEFLTDEMVSYMLFKDEAPMKDPMSGVSTFTQTFPQRGPRDKKGRSLRDFDLKTRVFRYPLSYMIYSPAFDAIPDTAKDVVLRKLFRALTAPVAGKDAELPAKDRQAILEILRDTKPGLPDYFRTASGG